MNNLAPPVGPQDTFLARSSSASWLVDVAPSRHKVVTIIPYYVFLPGACAFQYQPRGVDFVSCVRGR